MKIKFRAVIVLIMLPAMNCSDRGMLSGAGSGNSDEIMRCIDSSRYTEDLANIAVDRTLRSPGHDMVRDYCAKRLKQLGYRVELDSYGTGVNVIGTLEGNGRASEEVILSAHYDSRNAGCPGADDNASGVAGVLEAARVLSKGSYARTLKIALWDEEEKGLVGPRGLHGSRAYAARAKRERRKIVIAMVFEMIGYRSTEPGSQKFPVWMKKFFPAEMKKIEENGNRGDFICLTLDEKAREYSDIYTGFADAISLPSVVLKVGKGTINNHDFRRSDHTAFWEQGYPAMMLGDTINYRNKRYHCHNGEIDDISSLDIAFACDTVRAAAATVARILTPELR